MEECFLLPRQCMYKFRHIFLKSEYKLYLLGHLPQRMTLMTHIEESPVFLLNKSYSRPPTHAPFSRRPRPGTVKALKESFLRQASEFVPPLLRGSKCIRQLFSSSKGREWNNVDTERACEKEGMDSKFALLNGYAKDALKPSMKRHAKKPRRFGGSGSGGGVAHGRSPPPVTSRRRGWWRRRAFALVRSCVCHRRGARDRWEER